MGMDVYGKEAISEKGTYFRANVWYWHPLWEFCCTLRPSLEDEVPYGHSNDGDGLDGENAIQLSELLTDSLSSGFALRYITERQEILDKLPLEECQFCEGTGIRTDEVGVSLEMPEKKTCNGCQGKGQKKSFETNYHIDAETIKEFAEFLKDCGGFEIC